MRVYLESLGCKLNQCERDTYARQFADAGHTVVLVPEQADVCIVNTCAVTRTAAGKSRRRFHSLSRVNPLARLVAIGCYTSLGENGLNVDLAVENKSKHELVALIEARADSWDLFDRLPKPAVSSGILPRTRPMVKIQDGCDNACSYCVVHILRGRQRSRSRNEILGEIEQLLRQGYHEIVLTGVHVGSYGRDCGDNLIGLVQAILSHTAPERLRLSSIEPWDLTPDFFALWQDARLCRHLHLPLQSGCDETLQRMNRNYTVAQYARLVAHVREAVLDLALTTDLIAGFPGETPEAFAQSAAFVERMAFARAHVFSYSERPGTLAAAMSNQVDPLARRQRARRLREIVHRSGEVFRQKLLGSVVPVLWETRLSDGRWSGLTDNYVRVLADSSKCLENTLCPALLCGLERDGVRGRLV